MKGRITIINGHPNEGKTSLALTFVKKELDKGIPCLYFCIDTTSSQLKRKIHWLNDSIDLELNDKSLLDIRDTPSIKLKTILDIVKDYVLADIRPKVFVDYIQLIDDYHSSGYTDNNMNEVLGAFRQFSDTYGIDFFLVNMAMRKFQSMEKKWYTISSCQFPDAVKDADTMLFVKPSADRRPEYIMIKGDMIELEDGDNNASTSINRETLHEKIQELRCKAHWIPEEDLTDIITDGLLELAIGTQSKDNFCLDTAPSRHLFVTTNCPMISSLEAMAKARHYSYDLADIVDNEMFRELEQKIDSLVESIEDPGDYFGTKAFVNRNRAEMYLDRNDYSMAKKYLLEALSDASSSYDGVSSSDIKVLQIVLKLNGDKGFLRWLNKTISFVDKLNARYFKARRLEDDNNWAGYSENAFNCIDLRWEMVKDKAGYKDLYWIPTAIAQSYGLVGGRSVRSPKKESFDWHYARAEKGNKESISFIAEAYDTGNGVLKNDRLADFWKNRLNIKRSK